VDTVPAKKSAAKRPKPSFFKTPKGYVFLALLVLAGTAAFGAYTTNTFTTKGLTNIGIAVGAAIVIDYVCMLILRYKMRFPTGGLLTGLIVALVLSDMTKWWITATTVAIAIVSKHVLKIKRKPIFNPAAFGLLASLVLFSSLQSWWGGLSLLSPWYTVVLLFSGYVVTQRIDKFPLVLTFLAIYFAAFLTLGLYHVDIAGDGLREPFINSALFLAFFMLTDPPTSPAKYGSQVFFGILVAVISVGVYVKFGGLGYLLIGLLVANAWNAWRSSRNRAAVR
jgi:Na+-translocating ferredoxin:NAD+ oxidoreductase RnfD subunit